MLRCCDDWVVDPFSRSVAPWMELHGLTIAAYITWS